MKVTKIGHSCLIIEEGHAKILIDAGDFTADEQNNIHNLTHILITHQHADHCHPPTLKQILTRNAGVKIYTNREVGNLLIKEGIDYELLEAGHKKILAGVEVEGVGTDHHIIYKTLSPVMNTGYVLANKFFYPGDAFTNPQRPIKLLALPINAPWLTIAEALEYAQLVKPVACFPVHDGNIIRHDTLYRLAENILTPVGIKFLPITKGMIDYDL